MEVRRPLTENGFSIKSAAPSRVAATAFWMLPWPEIMITRTSGRSALIWRSSSMPSISGIQMSSRTSAGFSSAIVLSIIALAMGWGMCLGLGFARLVTLDILLYGASLLLEFMALAVLRFREPELVRPFRVPGGMFGAIAIGIPPMLLLGFSAIRSEHEQIWNMSSFAFGMILIAAGFVVYFINHALKPAGWTSRPEEKPQPAA